MLTRKRSKSFPAVGHTDFVEGQLQSNSASTYPRQSSTTREQKEPTDTQPSGQLQQSNPSVESPQPRLSEGSISFRADNRTADINAGMKTVAVSPEYSTIFYEIVRIQSGLPSFDIEIINAEDQVERAT